MRSVCAECTSAFLLTLTFAAMHSQATSIASSPRQLGPYLGQRAHLSLSWLSQYFLALLLVLVSLCFLLTSIPGLMNDGKAALYASCNGVEGAASVVASLPHYMADGMNEMNAKAVKVMVSGSATVLDLSLQAIQAIIL